jgi:hypothetical protein
VSAFCTIFQSSATWGAFTLLPDLSQRPPSRAKPLQKEKVWTTLNISSAHLHTLVPKDENEEWLEYLRHIYFWYYIHFSPIHDLNLCLVDSRNRPFNLAFWPVHRISYPSMYLDSIVLGSSNTFSEVTEGGQERKNDGGQELDLRHSLLLIPRIASPHL